MTAEYLTWLKFDMACLEIVRQARRHHKTFFDVYGIPRGGLVVAVKLSHLLRVPLIVNEDEITEETFVVDDITDTGKTLCEMTERGVIDASNLIATIYYHKQSAFVPDIWIHEKKTKWINFPWEVFK